MSSRPPALAKGALAAVVALSTLSQTSGAQAQEVEEEFGGPSLVAGLDRTSPWMEVAAPAGLRDLGPLVGLHPHALSYSVVVRDMNVDGWPDLFIGRHSWAAVLFLNEVEGGEAVRFARSAVLRDEIHHRNDRHGCAASDVDLDGLQDVYCAKGARKGTARKWNELWMQNSDGTFTDRAFAYGVQDVWGRGRFPVFLDLNHDPYPDLFVGNQIPRRDRHLTPNRTFVNQDGERFAEVRIGVTREIGNLCSVAADDNRNGWEDLLVCGADRLMLYRARPSGFRNVTEEVGLPDVRATAARFAHLSRDGLLDLVLTTVRGLQVRLQRPDHSYGPPVLSLPIRHGHGVAVGDPDGDGDEDIYVVEGCVRGRNMPDWLLVNGPGPSAFEPRSVARVQDGCGDTAEAIDFDGDGKDEFVVLNGGGTEQSLPRGPEQLLTLGSWGIAG
jgi:hypothetical protein